MNKDMHVWTERHMKQCEAGTWKCNANFWDGGVQALWHHRRAQPGGLAAAGHVTDSQCARWTADSGIMAWTPCSWKPDSLANLTQSKNRKHAIPSAQANHAFLSLKADTFGKLSDDFVRFHLLLSNSAWTNFPARRWIIADLRDWWNFKNLNPIPMRLLLIPKGNLGNELY
jgi:hypothetical protein